MLIAQGTLHNIILIFKFLATYGIVLLGGLTAEGLMLKIQVLIEIETLIEIIVHDSLILFILLNDMALLNSFHAVVFEHLCLLASERSERAQSCSCSIEISDTYVYIHIYVCSRTSSYVCACSVVRTVGGV